MRYPFLEILIKKRHSKCITLLINKYLKFYCETKRKKMQMDFFLLFCIIGKLGTVLLSCNRESLEFLSFIDFYNVNPSYLYVSSFFRCFLSSHFKSKLYLLEYIRYIFYYWAIWKMKNQIHVSMKEVTKLKVSVKI